MSDIYLKCPTTRTNKGIPGQITEVPLDALVLLVEFPALLVVDRIKADSSYTAPFMAACTARPQWPPAHGAVAGADLSDVLSRFMLAGTDWPTARKTRHKK
jgi:hypothetical protein